MFILIRNYNFANTEVIAMTDFTPRYAAYTSRMQ